MPDIIVIADTSCLIALTKIQALGFLEKLYREIYVTQEIAIEFSEKLPVWIKVESVRNKKYQQLLDLFLDKGEASAIALALEFDNVLLILDDLKGRKEAEKLGLKITGTLGVLMKAKHSGLIQELRPYIEELKTAGFRISPIVEKEILRRSDEV